MIKHKVGEGESNRVTATDSTQVGCVSNDKLVAGAKVTTIDNYKLCGGTKITADTVKESGW